MKIRILGWRATGLRCADVAVDLAADGGLPRRVALIQMPNGTGKTTALELLKGTLSGGILHWNANRISPLRNKDTKPDFGEFRLDLSVDGHALTFTTKLDFRDNTATMQTSSPLIGGVASGYTPPTAMRRFLDEKFVDLFVFDGELAGKMLQASETRAANAIDTLCQLDLIEQVITLCNEKWAIETRRGAKTDVGLTQYRNRFQTLTDRIRYVQKALRENEETRDECEAARAALKMRMDEIYRQDKDAERQYASIKEQIAKLEAELLSGQENIMTLARWPSALSPHISKCLFHFKENLDVLKLPDVTSRQFFTELAAAETCVCGRHIGEQERRRLLDEADQYLGDDISGIVNAIKQDIHQIANSTEDHSSALDSAIEDCKEKQARLEFLNTNLRALQKKLDESGQAQFQELQNKYDELTVSLNDAVSVIEEITRAPDPSQDKTDDSACLAWLEKQKAIVYEEIARITKTVELKDKIELIEEWLSRAREVARDNVKRIINQECNERLEQILGASPLRIAMIDNHIVLDGQAGASVGQTLAVGYTYLATLLRRGRNEFPLVVDSPAGPLDDLVRREVGRMVPELCEQFVAFMIKTEREDFLPALKEVAGEDISYVTIYRNTERTKSVKLEGVPAVNIVRTPEYTLVRGGKFFEEFTLVEC